MRKLRNHSKTKQNRLKFVFQLLIVALLATAIHFIWHSSAQERDIQVRGSDQGEKVIDRTVAGITVTNLTTQTPAGLVQTLIGNNTPYSNVKYTGANIASGSFAGGTGIIGFEGGVLLTTGSAQNVVGPNTVDGKTLSNNVAGDANLSVLAGYTTYDASVLEFDFVPSDNTVTFQYVFASEEYNEYANTTYNDVFAFFLNGSNVALLPGTTTPVSINNVNGGNPFGTSTKNPQYYRNNDLSDGGGSINTEMDGLTTVLGVTATVTPNQTNHIKLAIADGSDSNLDSAVFIKSSSFIVTPPAGQFVLSSDNYSIAEGNSASTVQTVTVNRIGGSAGAITVNYATSNGTATGGASCGGSVDYVTTSGTLNYADAETTKTFNVPICGDSTIEGNETITITLSTPTGGATLGTPATGTITITNDDSSSPTPTPSGTLTPTPTATATPSPTGTLTPTPTPGPTPMGAQPAILGTADSSNRAVVFPDAYTPTVQNLVPGLPSGAKPHGVAYFGSDSALLSDFGNSRIFVVKISTASLVATIDTAAAAYDGRGTVAVAPNLNAALAMGSGTSLKVIKAPFDASSTITSVTMPGSMGAWQTEAIVFNNAGRAFVYHSGGISILDAPYTSIAFTIPVTGNSSTGAIGITPDGGTLLVTTLSGSTVQIFKAPFSSASLPTSLTIPEGNALDGIAVAPNGASAIVVSSSARHAAAISAPFTSNSTVASIPLPPGGGSAGFEDVGISSDSQIAILTGNSQTDPAVHVRAPFGTSSVTTLVPISAASPTARGAGSVRFLPPGLAPGLTVSKTAPANVTAGSNLTYTITYSNTGTVNADNVVIRDPVPSGTTFVSATNGGTLVGSNVVFNVGTVVAGAAAQTVSFTVTVGATSGTIENNNYTIEGTGISPIPGPPVSTSVGTGTQPALAINDISLNERNAGTTQFTFNVTLSPASSQTVTANYTTANGTATAGSDYTSNAGTVTFNPTETTKPVTVLVTGDTVVEPNETYFVYLSSPVNATISDNQGIGTIVNDDGAGCTYSINPLGQTFSFAGGNGSVAVTTQAGCSWTAVSNSFAGGDSISNALAIFDLPQSIDPFLSPQNVFTNSAPITINDAAIASPYPSNITVSGMTGTITDLNVRINGLSHTFPDDVAYLLVSPDGTKKFILQSDSGGGTDVVNLIYTFDDQAADLIPDGGPMPANNTSVRPSSILDDDGMPPPAPALPYSQPATAGTATLNGTFGGISPNGVWSLYVVDFFTGDSGDISGGWSLDVTTSAPSGFINVTSGGNGTGSGTVNYSVTANTGAQRTGTMTIASEKFTVIQNAAGCSYSLSPGSLDVTAAAGSGSFTVNTSANCTWTAVSNDLSWLYVTSGTSGSGTGTVNFVYNSNSGAARSATISAGGQTFTLNQAVQATIPVTVQTNPVGRSFTVDGVGFTTTQAFNWIPGASHTIATTSPQAGTTGTQFVWSNWSDSGAMTHLVSPSAATTYTATFTTQYQLTMSAGAGGTVSPATGYYNSGQTVAISATANTGFSFSNWTGSGTGSYTGSANPSSVTMNGPITETAAFAQNCTFSINPAGQQIGAAGGNGSFALTTQTGCSWTAVSNRTWLTTTSTGSTSGTVNFTVAANTGSARSGTITVGGQTFTLDQAAAAGCVAVSLPANISTSPNTTITVPVAITDVSGRGAISYEFVIAFNPGVLRPVPGAAVDAAGTLSGSYSITPNTTVSGQLTVSAFGITPLTGQGTLINLKFEVLGTAGSNSGLTWTRFIFNEGDPCNVTSNGAVNIVNGSISGSVTFAIVGTQGLKGVPNTTMTAAGTPTATATTNAAGAYTLTGLSGGPYTVTPTKTGDNGGISAFDAALVAQHSAGVITLTSAQQAAADASNNGAVSAFDAALIAQTVAGVTNSGIAGQWKFLPPNRTYPTLSGDQTGQNYDAVLIGDVSGNWQPVIVSGAGFEEMTRYSSETAADVTVTLPATTGDNGASITIPINVGNLSGQGVIAFDFDLRFNSAVLVPAATPVTTAGTLSSAFNVTPNTATPGQFRVAAFGTVPLSGSGVLLNLNFNIVGAPGSTTALTWQSFQLNEGQPAATLATGTVTVNQGQQTFALLSGRTMTPDGRGLKNATVSLVDSQGVRRTALTNSFGFFSFDSVPTGASYTVTVLSKRYRFSAQPILVAGNMVVPDFVGVE